MIMHILFAATAMLLPVAAAHAVTPIHAYEFEGNVNDSIGGQNGTLIGGASVAGGRLILDGSNDYVEFGTTLVPTSGPYSVFIRVNGTPNLGGFTEIISQGFSGGTGFYIGTAPGGGIRLTDTIFTGVAFPNGESELLFSRSATGSKLYINGAEVFSTSILGANGAGGSNTRFGRQFGTFNEYFAGSIDAILIYDQAITPDALNAAVPEPAGWAMLIAGFGFIGAARRLRRIHNAGVSSAAA
jgi:hypothetical protein